MKKSFIILSSLVFLSLPVKAELTMDDVVSHDYLKNHEHSESLIYAAQKSRAMASGETYTAQPSETYDEYYEKPVIKQIRQLLMYLDPALDDHTFLNGHDTNPSTRYTDW